ncbi:hypothetical protein BC940DRAFT_335650 [Gongronella butleri]|nr:hypothetical protein BC940DRAFT_335650 [Gongronella butleri]
MNDQENLGVRHDTSLASLVSRPPSYKLDSQVDLEAFEAELHMAIQALRCVPRWTRQFHGIPLIFWLFVFMFTGGSSVLVPGLPVLALLLWVPLLLYFVVLLYAHAMQCRRERQLGDLYHDLTLIQQHRQARLLHATTLPSSLFFFQYYTDDHAHPVTTLMPPPPCYHVEDAPPPFHSAANQQPINTSSPA